MCNTVSTYVYMSICAYVYTFTLTYFLNYNDLLYIMYYIHVYKVFNRKGHLYK